MRARINSIELAYDDHGIGLPVLFLHAFPLNRTMWTATITSLLAEQRYRLVSPDWRGFGESELVSPVSTMDLLADDLAALMDHLGMLQAVLCGLSMGGYVAFAFLRKYPHRVRALILADTKPSPDNQEAQANREQVARIAETQGTGAIADLLLPDLLSEQTRQQHLSVEIALRRMIDAATPAGIAAASRGMALRPDSTALLPSIQVPTLVIVGEHDVLTPPSLTYDYAAHIPHAPVITIPHSGHLTGLEQPLFFLEAVRSFLSSLP